MRITSNALRAFAGLAAAASAALAASPASAAMLAALGDGDRIVLIDTGARKVVGKVKIGGGARLIGIDVRPADGRLYGVATNGAIVVIDHKTGKWEKRGQLSEKLPAGLSYVVDFNPAADRLRVMASDGTNLRVNVDDGKAIVDGRLRYADTDTAKGKPPRVIAGAYTNSFAGTKATTLYNIDAAAGTLLRQAPPNDGILNTVGSLGVKLAGPVALDVSSDGQGGNAAWLLSGGALHSVDLATGAAKRIGAIAGLEGQITDFAVLSAK